MTIGGGQAVTKSATSAGLSHFQIPFNGQTGQVVYTVSRNGQTVMTVQGTQISSSCSNVNWNAVTGSQTGSGSSVAASAGTNVASGSGNSSSNAVPSSATKSPASTTFVTKIAPASTAAATSSTASSVSSPSGSECTVNFSVKDTTQYGENIFIAGDDAALGSWSTDKALALNANQYTSAQHIWAGSAQLPAGANVAYKYFKKSTDGSITWQGANETLSVPSTCNGAVTKNDSIA